VALIGAGMVAETHVAACADAGLTITRIVSRGAERAAALADKAAALTGHRPDVGHDIVQVAKDPDVDFAIVLTPPNARAALMAPLAEAGKPILLEKPVARSQAEAQKVVEICRAAGVPLGIVFQHRMRAASVKAADLVASGSLGALGLAEFRVPWWRDQAYYDVPGRGTYDRDGGGVLINQAIHTMDLGLSLTGPVRRVQAMAQTTRFHQMEAEDFVTAGLVFENGAVGSLVASTASFPGGAESLTLHFDRASLHLEAGQLRLSWRDGQVETFGEEASTGGGADPMAFTHAWHQAILEDFVEALDTGRDPCVTGHAALASHALIDAIVASSRDGGRVVDVTAL